MERELLKRVIGEQREYPIPDQFFDRTQLNQIRALLQDPNIIIISGIRRSGKSTIMKCIQKEMKESDFFINFDDERLLQFKVKDFQMLHEVFIELYGNQKTFYFDEIQSITGWEMFVRRLHEQGNKIFITGSNSSLLSYELGSRLTGRFIPVEVFPLSFKEIMQHSNPELLNKKVMTTIDVGTLLGSFSNYLTYGGFPDFVLSRNIGYLTALYENILYRDILVRYKIMNPQPLKELSFYFASNVGKEFSYNNLCKILGVGSNHTISSYCQYLEECYLFFFVNRYSHSLQKQLHYNKKCYMIDPALIRLIGFRVSEDKGRLLENIVFLHLKTRNEDIYFHKGKYECDFVIRKGNRIYEAIQVVTSLNNLETKEREIAGLIEAMEEFQLDKGYILSENDFEEIDKFHNDKNYIIKVLPIWKWLLI